MFELIGLHIGLETPVGYPMVDVQLAAEMLFAETTLTASEAVSFSRQAGLDSPVCPSLVRSMFNLDSCAIWNQRPGAAALRGAEQMHDTTCGGEP